MRELIARSAASSPVHSVRVVVQLDARKAATHIRRRGGGVQGAASVLEEQVRWISSGLREMGVDVLGLVAPQQLADLFKSWFDPRGRAERPADRALGADSLARASSPGRWCSRATRTRLVPGWRMMVVVHFH